MSEAAMDIFHHNSTNKHKSNFIELSHLNAHSNNLPQGGDASNEPVYFSRITQQWEPVWFYATMLKKLGSFAQAIDRCARSSRELVWSHIFYLYNQANRKCSDMFTPIIDEWCQSQSIDLSALEIMYTSFLQIYNQYPGLFEDVPPSSNPSSDAPTFSYSSTPFGEGKTMDFKKEEPKVKLIKLNNTGLIWGNNFAAAMQQFSLLLSWAPLLEKLPPNQKEAIWNTCQFFSLFSSDAFDRASFRKTFLKWAGNLPAHMSHITILFGAIGFLRDKGIIKHQFFYPNTTVPVFNRNSNTNATSGGKSQTPTTPQYHSSSSHSSHFTSPTPPSPSPISILVPSTSAPSTPSRSSDSSNEFLTPSRTPHHFFPPVHSEHESTPRNAKSLPFDSLSLPPLSIPPQSSTILPMPSLQPASSTTPLPSSSRLGLLALAAFQADDTEAPAPPKILSPAKPQDPKQPTESSPTLPKSEVPLASPEQSKEAPKQTKLDSIELRSLPTEKLLKLEPGPAPTMKIVKRKNSAADYHDEEKRPRTMNLSHILCS